MILYLLISEPDVSACVPAVATIAPLASICVMHVCGWARACVCTCVCVSVSLSQPLPQPLPPFRHDPSVGKTPKITVTHTPFSIPHTHIGAHMCTRGFKTIKTQRGEEGTELKNTKGKKKNLFSFQKTAGKIHAFTRTHKRGINTKTNTHTHTLSLCLSLACIRLREDHEHAAKWSGSKRARCLEAAHCCTATNLRPGPLELSQRATTASNAPALPWFIRLVKQECNSCNNKDCEHKKSC